MARGVWPLIGRNEELDVIEAALSRSDGRRSVVLAGPAGVGKTRLAREVLASADGRGALIRWVVGTESARALPLGAFSGLLGAVGSDPTTLLPRTAAALLDGTGRAGALVGVDDAHLLDDVSALLLHHLAVDSPASVVITVRSGMPAPDAVTRLWKEGLLERVELQCLSEIETADLLARVLDGQVGTSTTSRLWTMTGGNPLYLKLLVDGELAAGRLRPTQGVWRWAGDIEVAPGLAEQVTAHMGRTTRSVAAVLDVLALAEPLGVAELRALTRPSAVEVAEERGLVTVHSDGRRLHARLAHPLYGEVRRESIGRVRARRMRAEIASALIKTGSRRADDALRLAVLAVDSDLQLDADVLLAGARRAAQLYDLSLAERLARAAVAAGGGVDAQLLVTSMVAAISNNTSDEVEILIELSGPDAQSAGAVAARVVQLGWITGEPAAAESFALASEDRLGRDAGLPVTAVRSYLVACSGRPHLALDLARRVLDGQPADESIAFASCARALALATTGRADDLLDVARIGYEAARRSPDVAFLRVPMAGLEVVGMRLAGRPRRALAVAQECLADVNRMFPAEVFAGYVLGEAELACGLVRSALSRMTEANATLTGTGGGGFEYSCRIHLAQALALAGDAAASRAILDDMLAEPDPTMRCLLPDSMLAQAWTSAAEGVTSVAVSQAHAAATIAAEYGQSAHEVLALHVAARLGDGSVAGRLRQLAAEVDGPRALAAAEYADAVAADDPLGLATASDAFEQMGDMLAAADAAAQASVSHDRQGHRADALAASRRAGRLSEVCEGARTPALVAALRPLPVTDREREILSMAAAGMTNQQIATQLVVSVRTVEGHLYRAGAKIGTTDRTGFGAILNGT